MLLKSILATITILKKRGFDYENIFVNFMARMAFCSLR